MVHLRISCKPGCTRFGLIVLREGEELPKESSPNFSQAEIGEVILDVIVEPGDLLYFPRGTIHQVRLYSEQ